MTAAAKNEEETLFPFRDIQQPQLQINLIIQHKQERPGIEMRRLFLNEADIKIILDCAFFNKPVIIFPVFKDKLRAVSSLIQNRIIEYNSKTKEYKYLI